MSPSCQAAARPMLPSRRGRIRQAGTLVTGVADQGVASKRPASAIARRRLDFDHVPTMAREDGAAGRTQYHLAEGVTHPRQRVEGALLSGGCRNLVQA